MQPENWFAGYGGADACTLAQPKRETMPLTRPRHNRGTLDSPMAKSDHNQGCSRRRPRHCCEHGCARCRSNMCRCKNAAPITSLKPLRHQMLICVDGIARTPETSCLWKRNQPAKCMPETFKDSPEASEHWSAIACRVNLGTPLTPETIASIAHRTNLKGRPKPRMGLLGKPAVTQR